jgi:cathepsin F
LVALLVFAAVCSALPKSDSEIKKQFLAFQTKFNKTYATSEEFLNRYTIFKTNLAKADELNRRETGTATYGVTKFSDLSEEEFRRQYLMSKSLHSNVQSLYTRAPLVDVVPNATIPADGMDWRDKGAITPVYNQEQCGSCWAFSATETIESYYHLCGHGLPNLSVQQVVDCDKTSYGCEGGFTENAYEYVIKAKGQDSWKSYPYRAVDESCRFKPADIAAKISSYKYVTKSKDEKGAMLNWVTSNGPLSVCVDASSWSSYNGGVMKNCGKDIDHCVQVTGYSTQNGVPVWHVRNSWGTDWGIQGYILIERNHDVCAIAQDVTVVTC